MSDAPFVIDPERTAIAIGYRNNAYIADDVLVRVPVGKQEFKYLNYDVAEDFTPPETEIGRRGQANEVEFGATELESSTVDHGLDDFVPQNDIDNAPANYDPLDRATMSTTELMLIRRELRAANVVHAAANYHATCKVTLAGTDQWSDMDDSDPIDDILVGLDAPLVRPNIGVFGNDVWSKLRVHPKIVKAVHGNSGDSGIAARRAVADLLELEDIYVGVARRNTAKKGQAAALSRIWGKHAAFLYRDRNADTRGGLTFGLTAEWRSRTVMTRPDPKRGGWGGQDVMVRESVKELAVADRAGYLVVNAVA